MDELTNRQRSIINFIETSSKDNGFPPTIREIGDGDGVGLISNSTVYSHLLRLEKKGYIRRDPTKPRAMELLRPEERQLVVSDISDKDRNKLFIELVKRGYSVEV